MVSSGGFWCGILKDLRGLLFGWEVAAVGGVASVAVALLPHRVLPFPWEARLAIGTAGAVMIGACLPGLCRWVWNGSPR